MSGIKKTTKKHIYYYFFHRMAFPVDILTNVDHEFLELAAEEYMSQILYRNPDKAEYLSLPDSKQVRCEVLSMSASFPFKKYN